MRTRKAATKLAKRREFPIGSFDDLTPQDLYDEARRRLVALGYRFVRKSKGNGKLSRMSTTTRRTIWLGTNWPKKTIAEKAALLWHELTHARQMRRRRGWFFLYGADSLFRWAMEAQAYRVMIQVYRACGYTDRELRDYARALAKSLPRTYVIKRRSHRRHVESWTAAIVLLK